MNLGIFARSAAGPKNNELGQISDLGAARRRAEDRERWANQRAAAGLLEGERVRDCQRSLNRVGVEIERDPDTGRTGFAGVLTCDSRWHCPLCARKLTERDRAELQRAITRWTVQGGAVYLVTQTFRHDLALELRDGIERMQRAQRRFKGARRYKEIMRAVGAIGAVKALEVTYGANGWHPHTHTLIFARPGAEGALGGLRELWASAVERVGLGRVNEHGFDVRGGDFAADYVAKFGKEPSNASREQARAWWTAADEVTRGHTKQTTRLKGATPFTLLRWYREGDARAGALFVEYARAFKGKAQLYWSPRLRKKIDLLELQDPKPARARPELVIRIERADWWRVIEHDARWELLHVAELRGAPGVEELLAELRKRRGRWRGDFRWRDERLGMMNVNQPPDQWRNHGWEKIA